MTVTHSKATEAASVEVDRFSRARHGEPAIEVAGLSHAFAGSLVLDAVTMRFPPGSVAGIVGENGAGKSTLFNVLSGLLPIQRGELRLRGRAVGSGVVRSG